VVSSPRTDPLLFAPPPSDRKIRGLWVALQLILL